MIDVEGAYATVHNLHTYLSEWAGHYVSTAGACRVACIASSRLFSLATVLWDTEEGPYAEAINLAVPVLVRQALSEGVMGLGAVESHPCLPSDKFIEDIAAVYAVTYMAAQMGHWSFSEREDVARALRVQHIRTVDPASVRSWLSSGKLGSVPIRRAVEQLDLHVCGGDLICVAAEAADQAEREAGLRWVREARRLEALSS